MPTLVSSALLLSRVPCLRVALELPGAGTCFPARPQSSVTAGGRAQPGFSPSLKPCQPPSPAQALGDVTGTLLGAAWPEPKTLLLPLVGVSGTFCVASVPHLNPLPGCTFHACRHKMSCPLCCFFAGFFLASRLAEGCSHAELGGRRGRRVPPGARSVPGAAPGFPSAPEPCLSSAVDTDCVVSLWISSSSSWWLTCVGTAVLGDSGLLMPEGFSGD